MIEVNHQSVSFNQAVYFPNEVIVKPHGNESLLEEAMSNHVKIFDKIKLQEKINKT